MLKRKKARKAILAYYFLLANEQPLSRKELDHLIELWMADKYGCAIDFEIDDALEKLRTLGLVWESEGKLLAVSIDKGIQKLDQRWDDYFTPS